MQPETTRALRAACDRGPQRDRAAARRRCRLAGSVSRVPAVPDEAYEPPSIEDRSPIALPLVATTGGSAAPSAAFRPSPSESYEPPAIEARDPIGIPLVGGPATSGII